MILDGRTVANHILEQLTQRITNLEKDHNVIPHLAVVYVGNDPATLSYISQKEKKGKQIGAVVSVYKHSENITQQKLQETIDFLQRDESIHGIILQLPIPSHLQSDRLIQSISPQKDVDGFVTNSQFTVPIASAIFKLLEVPCSKDTMETGESYNEWLRSKKFVVMGKGKTGGLPIIQELKKREVELDIIDSQTRNPEHLTKQADIIITAVGRKGILTKDMIKKDVILLNVGMTRGDDEMFYGDYNERDIQDIASWYTPTPGGVGPVNVACLLENVVIAAENTIKN